MTPLGFAYVYGFWVTLLALCAIAAVRGQWLERAVAFAYLGASLATTASVGTSVYPVEYGVLAVDVALAAFLAAAALRSGRWWLICATSFQILATLAHLSRVVHADMSNLAYALMEGASSWPALICLAIGLAEKRGPAHRSGIDASSPQR